MRTTVAAVDLGATSGRVILGQAGKDTLRLTPVHRFPNGPVRGGDGLHWDASGLYGNVLAGLARAVRLEPELVSVGVDAWAVDYGLLRAGRLLGEPFHHRDERSLAGVAAVEESMRRADLYAANGLQFLPFNTIYQLVTDRLAGRLSEEPAGADSFLLIPDLLNFWLTGERLAERTNASTTGLLGVRSREWDDTVIGAAGLPRAIFAPLADAGSAVGAVRSEVAAGLGTSGRGLAVTAVGSHDTASAVVAVPAADPDFAYISCGTWALVGVELEAPILTEAGRRANFTNEGGVDGRVRYLRNVMGLWLLNETLREWESAREGVDLSVLLTAAAEVAGPVPIVDVDDERFVAPGPMTPRLLAYCRESGLPFPDSRAGLVRCILESLAEAYAHAVGQARALSGKAVSAIHVVGGGSLNALLCQLIADKSGIPVLAGPVEATAIGNILVQARASGAAPGSLESLRALVRREFPPQRFGPRPSGSMSGARLISGGRSGV